MTVDGDFIASIDSMADYLWAVQHGVNDRMFTDGLSHWTWLGAYVNRTQEVPPRELLQRQFSDFAAQDSVGDVKYQYEQLRNAFVARTLRSVIYQNGDSIDSNPMGALDNIVTTLIGIQRSEAPNFSYYDKDAEERVLALLARKAALAGGTTAGIPTGIEILDIQQYGWQPGEFSAFIARPGAGKTELLALCAVAAWQSGKRVLVVSSEMTREKFMLRMDPILAHRRGQSIPSNRALLSGAVRDDQVAEYQRFTKSLINSNDMLVMDQQGQRSQLTIDDVAMHARNHRADMVIIDGLKLLGARGVSGIERYQTIIKSCHDLAQSDGMVVLGAEHTARIVESNKMPDMNQVYNGEAIPQFAERIITMMVPTGIQKQRLIAVQKSRDGGAVPRRKAISFDPDTGDVGRWVDPMDVKLASELSEFLGNSPAPMVGETSTAAMMELDLS